MSKKRFVVELSPQEREQLRAVLHAKRVAARKRRRAQILLKIDEGEHGPQWTDARAADAFEVSVNTIVNIRRDLVAQGLDQAIAREEQKTPRRPRVIEASVERELLAIAESEPPRGRARWTLHLLADRMVQLEVVESVSHETVRKALKKTNSSRIAKSRG